jgi:hypothetical protein
MGSKIAGSQENQMCLRLGWKSTLAAALLLLPLLTQTVLAHASERGQVLLLPTNYYIFGGATAVLASVLLAVFLPAPAVPATTPKIRLFSPPPWLAPVISLAICMVILVLLVDGVWGPPDPIGNPLPGFVWGIFWLGLSFITVLIGNIWHFLNPWRGLLWLTGRIKPMAAYPEWLGHWPAVAQFLVFAWVELVDPRPVDPGHLASLAAIYLFCNGAGAAVFGLGIWLEQADPFAAYFRMVGKLSPVEWSRRESGVLRLRWPGQGLLEARPATLSEAAFVILSLATVSFDGLSHTFAWVGALSLNPLEFPGRTAVVVQNSEGLAMMAVALAAAYLSAVTAIPRAARPGLVWAIVPIAVAYHLAHYLPDAPLEIMRALHSIGDALGRFDVVGFGKTEPPASLIMDQWAAHWFYRAQTGLIVAGHIAAVVIGHLRVSQLQLSRGRTFAAEAPLNLLMIGYTLFGLWLLSTAVIG